MSNNVSMQYLLDILYKHHEKYLKTINLVPSENVLSPLSKLPYQLDAHSRYFLDDLRLFGDWSFPRGKELGEIEGELLIPCLKDLSKAKYVNVRPLSGMNCMMIALSSLTKPGDIIYTIPIMAGGHACTTGVAESLGLKVKYIPFENEFDINYEELAKNIERDLPKLVYIDQSTFLFPIDPQPIRDIINRLSVETLIHYDSSHTNGLIFGEILDNPLDRGSDCFGGSTHKTLPGPQKGFLATNNPVIAENIQRRADSLVSQHNMASTISLAITLLEFKMCGGKDLMNQIMKNTYSFCSSISSDSTLKIHGKSRGFTRCHQIWLYPENRNVRNVYNQMIDAGIIFNLFNSLPGINQPSYRLSLSEFSRIGAKEEDSIVLAECINSIVDKEYASDLIKQRIRELRGKFTGVQYCFKECDFEHRH